MTSQHRIVDLPAALTARFRRGRRGASLTSYGRVTALMLVVLVLSPFERSYADDEDPWIIEGTASTVVRVADDPEKLPLGNDHAKVEIMARLGINTIMGSPVVACTAKWRLIDVVVDGIRVTIIPGTLSEVARQVVNAANLYSTDGIFRIWHSEHGYRDTELQVPCDLGVMGPADFDSASYNVAGSPSLDELFIALPQERLPKNPAAPISRISAENYLSAEAARDELGRAKENLGGSIYEGMGEGPYIVGENLRVLGARINLGSFREIVSADTHSSSRVYDLNDVLADSDDPPPDSAESMQKTRRKARKELQSVSPDIAPERAGSNLESFVDTQRRLMEQGMDSLSPQKANRKAPVSGVEIPHEPSTNNVGATLLLLVDTSGSMDGERIRDAKKAAKDVIDNSLRQNTEVGVLGFSGNCDHPVPMRHPFSDDATSLHRFVDRLSANGGTPMSAAVEYANRYMAINRSPAGKSEMIILLADGDDNCDILSPVVRDLKKDGVLFRHQTVGLEIDSGSSAARDLRKLAKNSDGDYQYAANSSHLNETFRRAMLAMEMLDMLGRFGENKQSAPPDKTEADPTQTILDGFE